MSKFPAPTSPADEQMNNSFLWPCASQLPERPVAQALYKPDAFLQSLEDLVGQGKAWTPILGSTKRTESEEKLRDWIAEQNRKQQRLDARLSEPLSANLQLQDFPFDAGSSSRRVITTARNIAYLLDSTGDLLQIIGQVFGQDRCAQATPVLNPKLGTFLYVTNSIESGGRALSGDPFTGQAVAFSRIFAHDLFGERVLNFVAYYPHQLPGQCFTTTGNVPSNKGVRMLRSQATLLVMSGGHLVEPSAWRLLSQSV